MDADREDRLQRIVDAWLDAQAHGRALDPEEVIRRHPELAAELRECFAALEALDDCAGSTDVAYPPPTEIGGYRILREAGRGAMGIVYEAEHADGRRVALKTLSPAVSGHTDAKVRFFREARAAIRLDHPNVVKVFEFGEDRRFVYYSMEYVSGRSLRDWIRARRAESTARSFDVVARLFADVGRGLQAAAELEIVHRDIKPSNILLEPDGTPKLGDFGLARVGGATETLTDSGLVLGTLAYMSPEQASAQRSDVDACSDVYSLGASFYEALTLRAPFREESPAAMIAKIIAVEPPRPRTLDPSIPRELETITLKAMAKSRRLRYATAREFSDDLDRFLRGERIRARRPGSLIRGREWARRHPARALALSVPLLAAVLLVLWLANPEGPDAAERSLTGRILRKALPDAVAALEAGGIRGDARIEAWTEFADPAGGVGSVLAVRSPDWPAARLDLCAVDERGALLWSARHRGSAYEFALGSATARVRSLRSIATLWTGRDLEESLLVNVEFAGKLALLIVDPATGALRGSWAYPGGYYDETPRSILVATLPDGTTNERRLLIGSSAVVEGKERPVVCVVEPDGTELQRLILPVLGLRTSDPYRVYNIVTTWPPNDPEVEVSTNEELYFYFVVRDGLLVASSARVRDADLVTREYDKLHGPGAFERFVREQSPVFGYRGKLVAQVREERG